jgi:hypothetical protein
MQLGSIILIAALRFDFSSTETKRHSAHANVVLAGSVADNWRLSVMSNLGSNLASCTDAGVGSATTAAD